MNAQAEYRLRLAHAHRERDLARAANARAVRERLAARRPPLRRIVGRSIIRLGERLASEPSLEPARPR